MIYGWSLCLNNKTTLFGHMWANNKNTKFYGNNKINSNDSNKNKSNYNYYYNNNNNNKGEGILFHSTISLALSQRNQEKEKSSQYIWHWHYIGKCASQNLSSNFFYQSRLFLNRFFFSFWGFLFLLVVFLDSHFSTILFCTQEECT